MDNNYRPMLLSTQQQLAAYWPQIAPLLATAPISNEYSPDDLLQAAIAKAMFVFVVQKDTMEGPEVELVLVTAPVPAEKFPVMNIVVVAGKNLRKHIRRFWDYFKGWCYISGARAIDAYVPERMEEFLKKELGLVRETIHVRLCL